LKTSSCKAKGRDLQIFIGKKVAELLGLEFGRDKDVASREMGQAGSDLRLSPKAQELFNYDVECKNHNKWNVPAAIRQTKARCPDGMDWLLFFKRTSKKSDERIPPVVILDAETFFKILEKVYEKVNQDTT
jgi:hypothetical protein